MNIFNDGWHSSHLWLRDRRVFHLPDSVIQNEKRGNGIKKRSTTLCHLLKEVALPDDTLATDAAISQLK